MAEKSIRGAGTDRAGATDMTAFIWKAIDANPGIDREDLIAKVQPEVPSGWAARRKITAIDRVISMRSHRDNPIDRRRRYLVVQRLSQMVQNGSIRRDADGNYFVQRPLRRYRGDLSQIDVTRTVAAQHMDTAMAIRTVVAFRRRSSHRMTDAELHALDRVIAALRGRCTCSVAEAT